MNRHSFSMKMSATQPASKYFRPIMIISTLYFLNRRKNNKLVYYLQNFIAVMIVCVNLYSTYLNLFDGDINVDDYDSFKTIMKFFLMLALMSTVLVTYCNSVRNYKMAAVLINKLNMADKRIEMIGNHINIKSKKLDLIKQYSSWDCPLIISWFTMCYLGAKIAEYIRFGDSQNFITFTVFITGMFLFIHNVTIVFLFQRVLVKKYKLINYVLLQLIITDIQSVYRIDIIKNVKIVWKLCAEVLKNFINAFGINILMICMLSYDGMVVNMFNIIRGEWSSLFYGIIPFSGIISMIWVREAINIEVKINFNHI